MTGLGEEVYTAPAGDGVGAMVEAAGRADYASAPGYWDRLPAIERKVLCDSARVALESLGIPMEVLAVVALYRGVFHPERHLVQPDYAGLH